MGKPARHLLFTFDHELFLGRRSGSVDRCMIQPVRRVLEVLERFGLKAMFYVDTTYLLRLRELAPIHPALARDLAALGEQLVDLARRGHEVHPHIHPHWLDAHYDAKAGEWSLEDLSKYRFAAIDEATRTSLFDGSMDMLNAILRKGDPGHQVDAFRAGGWGIQPFEDFLPHFRKHGIRYDLTVLPGSKAVTNAVRYDFTAPLPGPIYRFTNDVMVPEPDGEFTELAISSIPRPRKSTMDRLLAKVLWRLEHGRQIGDGHGVLFNDLEPDRLRGRDKEMVSVELLTALRVKAYQNFVDGHTFTQFISHPKMISPHNLSMLDTLLRRLALRYELRSDWRTLVTSSSLSPAGKE